MTTSHNPTSRRTALAALAAALGLCASCQSPAADPPPHAPSPGAATGAHPATRPAGTAPLPAAGDTKMDRDEDAAEGVANWLLGMADVVRAEDWPALTPFFADEFHAGPLPQPTAARTAEAPGVETMAWEVPADGVTLNHDNVATELARYFGRWSEFQHLWFKVKAADIDRDDRSRVHVKIRLQIVATRAGAGPEEFEGWWLTDVKTLPPAPDAKKEDGPSYQIVSIEAQPFRSQVADRPFFTEVSRSTGLAKNSPRFGTQGNSGFNWKGVAAADFDSDGDLDLFLPARGSNHLYRNEGDGSFVDVANEVGLALPADGTGTVFFDFDNDGDQDIFMSRVGLQVLFENRLVPDGEARFQDISGSSGVASRPVFGFGVAVADIEGDGDLDIYVAAYNAYGDVMPNSWFAATNGLPNLLYRNDGNGQFRDIARDSGMAGDRWSYAPAFADYDLDGDQDLYVANDYGPNNLYRNDGTGHFADVAEEVGALDPGNGMGVSWGDYDNDGLLDLYVMNMSSTAGNRILKRLFEAEHRDDVEKTLFKLAAGNTMLHNRGDGKFDDVSGKTGGVGAAWAWGGGFTDIDNDGYEDIVVANGFITGKSAKDT